MTIQKWDNNDGLRVRFGPDAFGPKTGGEYKNNGALREIEFRLDLTTLTSTSVSIDDVTDVPKGMIVEEVVLEVQTAATSGGTPTLDVGYTQTDNTTVISNTAFINAEVLSGVLDTLGKKITYTVGVSKAGGVVGTTTSSTLVGRVSARANTATFTAGVVIVRIRYRPSFT